MPTTTTTKSNNSSAMTLLTIFMAAAVNGDTWPDISHVLANDPDLYELYQRLRSSHYRDHSVTFSSKGDAGLFRLGSDGDGGGGDSDDDLVRAGLDHVLALGLVDDGGDDDFREDDGGGGDSHDDDDDCGDDDFREDDGGGGDSDDDDDDDNEDLKFDGTHLDRKLECGNYHPLLPGMGVQRWACLWQCHQISQEE